MEMPTILNHLTFKQVIAISFTFNVMLQHDLYYLGQLGLVIRMLKED